jgi:HlyD family secretion protein
MKALDLQIVSANEGFTMLTTGLDSSEQQMAENSSQIAKLELQRSQLLLSKYSIASSVDGIVESINYQQGEFVNTGTPVISLVHKEKRHVTIYVQEKDLPSIYVGDKLFFSLVSNEAVTLEGTVTKISEKAMFTPMNIVTTKDRARLVFPVELSLAPSDALASGMLLQTKLHKGE